MKCNIKKTIYNCVSYFALGISILLIVFSLYYLLQIKIKNKKFVNVFGYTFLQVKSGSMEKELLVGDIILVKLLNKENNKDIIKVNDIITFSENNYLITHRIVELNENDLITKGDANNVSDKAISYKSIEGIVIKDLFNLLILKNVFLETEVLLPLSSAIFLFVIALLIDTNEDRRKKDINEEEQRKKIQKGKRFKN